MTSQDASPARTDLLRWDEKNDEPYMFIPRFPDIRMTPWRESDADAAVKLYNSPNVSKWSFRRPYPYLPEHLEWQRTNLNPPARECIKNILAPLLRPPIIPSHPLPSPSTSSPVPFFPLMVVRHVPTGEMIGDFFLFQPIPETATAEDEAALFGGQAPQTLPPSEQKWELGYNLLPEWSGMGIGGAILDIIIESWVKWIGIGTLVARAETINTGSSGLVKSRGFKKVNTCMEQWPEDKGGGKREVNDWQLKMVDHISRSLELSQKDADTLTRSSSGLARTDLLRWDRELDEPYLLISRFPDIRLTPWREDDVDAVVEMFNAPDVAKWSYGRPVPFTRDDLGWRRGEIAECAEEVVDKLLRPLLSRPANPSHPIPPPSTDEIPVFPLHVIRHVPSGKAIGEIWLLPPSLAAPQESTCEADEDIPPNAQTWELVYNLHPDWAGKGIAGAVLDVVIESWVKWVGIGTLMADAETANIGSAGLVKSRGFVKTKTYMLKWPEDQGGGVREVNRWQLNVAAHKPRSLVPAQAQSMARTDLWRWDKEMDEPYLAIPRMPDLRLTPWREEDAEMIVELYNTPHISKWSYGRPFPYRIENLKWRRDAIIAPSTVVIEELLRPVLCSTPSPTHPLPPLSSDPTPIFPLHIIRHVPTGRAIGEIWIYSPKLTESSASEGEVSENNVKGVPAGKQTWELVYNLNPDWAGKGIAGAALDVVIEAWVKWIGIGTLMADVESANVGSAGLVKSRGFVKTKTYMQEWPEDKGGGEREINRWQLVIKDHKSRSID